jgi:hypothetical protein
MVDADWLMRQLGADADMVLGVVRISTWRGFPAAATRLYQAAYQSKNHPGGRGHFHWGEHGISRRLVLAGRRIRWIGERRGRRSGRPFRVDLVARFESAGLRILRDAQLSVVTSRRQLGRAPEASPRT